ncbi:hypothetical protein HA38_19505 [Pantoea allii]|nr:hypothetical protein HA38_19505 [Pantoea allii]
MFFNQALGKGLRLFNLINVNFLLTTRACVLIQFACAMRDYASSKQSCDKKIMLLRHLKLNAIKMVPMIEATK